jgi:hypothetical protein
MTYSEVDKQTFFDRVDTIEYREQDIQEAREFGCKSIKACYTKAVHRFAKYFIVYDEYTPIVTVMLQRDGYIIFFISKNVNSPVKLIKVLKRLANKVTKNAGAIITKTAKWYTEAQRLNRIIGFKDYQIYDYFGYYVKE